MTKAKTATRKSAARKRVVKKATPKPAAGNTFTTVQLAAERDMQPKTLRARIRRHLDKWEPLFVQGKRHVFADNKTTRAKIDALLA